MTTLKSLFMLIACLCVGGSVGALAAVVPTIFVTSALPGAAPQLNIVPGNLTYGRIAALITVPSALIVGLPCFYLLRWSNLLNWMSACIVGPLAGIVIAIAFKPGLLANQEWFYAAGIGLVSSAVSFVLISRSKLLNGKTDIRASATATK